MYDGGVLDELDKVLDKLCAAEPTALADGQSIEALHRCLARLEAVATRATAAFDASREWESDGARSAASWLTATCHLPSLPHDDACASGVAFVTCLWPRKPGLAVTSAPHRYRP